MIYKTKAGNLRKIIIKDSPKSFEYLKNRFGHYKGLLITQDINGLNQGSISIYENKTLQAT